MSGGYNRGPYPPPPASYSPSVPSYGGDHNGFRPPPVPPAGFPPFPPPPFPGHHAPPMPPTSFRSPYDEYSPSGPSSMPQPPAKFGSGSSFDARSPDVYDPYQPATYDPGAPQLRTATPSYTPPTSASSSHAPHRLPSRPGETHDLPLLTSPTTATIGNYTTTVYSLPPSHLPITKYVTVNPGDAIDVHRAICQSGMAQSIWYADGQTRAGEGWGAAVEWVLETGMSGAKMRTNVGAADALGTELGAMLKAVEGFRDHLHQSIKTQKPMSHEFVLFVSSAAAIVSIDTSSRPESLQFCEMWRDICTDYLRAHLTLVHMPKGSDVEGFILAEKIANVAASNSYTKRKKERILEEIYNRPGGGEPAPGGSTEAGAWQRGDADPSRRKPPFERPRPQSSPPRSQERSVSPPRPRSPPRHASPPPQRSASQSRPEPPTVPEADDDGVQPRAGALFVTSFPEHACAKDLGILFAQFGEIVSVDIFSLPPVKQRFAFVAYSDPSDLSKAIQALHRRAIDLDTPFARENAEDLAIWKGWGGQLTVVESDADRLVPLSVAKDFPELPAYATGSKQSVPQKRERGDDNSPMLDSPSSKKSRPDLTSNAPEASTAAPDSHASSISARPAGLPPRPASSFDTPDSGASATAATNGSASHAAVPATPLTALVDGKSPSVAVQSPHTEASGGGKPLTSTETPEVPIKLSGRTLQAQIDLINKVFVKHERDNWIAHSCLIATDLDQARRQLQDDLYGTDEASIESRKLESELSTRGFTVPKMDAFVSKVLKVLDGIAAEDEAENGGEAGADAQKTETDVAPLQAELDRLLADYPAQTRDAMAAAGKVLEYLNRGKDAQEAKRLHIERRVGVLEGMVQKGEHVTGVVRYLLSQSG